MLHQRPPGCFRWLRFNASVGQLLMQRLWVNLRCTFLRLTAQALLLPPTQLVGHSECNTARPHTDRLQDIVKLTKPKYGNNMQSRWVRVCEAEAMVPR